MHTGSHNYRRVAESNKIKNSDLIFPGMRIALNIPKWALHQEQSYRNYVVKIFRHGEDFFQILKDGRQVYAGKGFHFKIGSIYEDEKTNSLISIGTDITGDGQPNLVISEWTGGAHCCFNFHLFQIGEPFRYIQTIDAGDSDLADFARLGANPALEFIMADWTFAYWRTSFAQSPAPEVILKYRGRKYEMANELMQKPALTRDELKRIANEIRALPEWNQKCPPVKLWDEMLRLIYAGNMPQAWILADLSWPEGTCPKQEFLKDFKATLKKSPYWRDVQKLNRQ